MCETDIIEMDYFDSELIITEVEKYPCIYNTKSQDYKDRSLKLEAWTNVFRTVVGDFWDSLNKRRQHEIGKEIQKRWKNMRDAYKRTIVNVLNTKSGSDETYKKKPYVYHKQMSFLQDVMDLRPTYGNMNDESLLETGGSEPQIGPWDYIESVQLEKKTPSTSRKRKLQDPFERDLINVMSGSSQPPEKDRDEMFLKSLLPYLKTMSNDDKLDFQIQTLQLIRTYTRQAADQINRTVSESST